MKSRHNTAMLLGAMCLPLYDQFCILEPEFEEAESHA
jgi:hypothetical protein